MSAPIIPDAALENHIAILAKTGAGKSNAAKTITERLLDRGERVCVIDPTGTWWGLRLMPNGKPSPYRVLIFGGHHADVQIRAQDGAAIAEVVGTSATSCIIDTRLFTVGERTQFFTGFAEALLRTNRGALTLIIDEAHVFAPKGKVADPKSGVMLHATSNLVSLGRGLGLRIIMISQRPAKLHNDCLGQVETLVAMRMILPHDRAAVMDWMKEQADAKTGQEIMAGISSLPTGDAWIWAPALDILEKRHFPLAATMDTGRAQAAAQDVRLEPLELEQITARLAEVAAEVLANDPKHLKAEIQRLTRELAQRPAGADPAAIEAAVERGREEVRAGFFDQMREFKAMGWAEGQADMLRRVKETMGALTAQMAPARAEPQIRQAAAEKSTEPAVVKQGAPMHPWEAGVLRPPLGHGAGGATTDAPDMAVTPALQKILDALAWRETLTLEPGHVTAKPVLAFLVGMSAGGGGFNNYLGKLRSGGYVEYAPGGVALTEAGRAIAQPPNAITNEEVQAAAFAKLQPQLARIMGILVRHWPSAVGRDFLAGEMDMQPSGGGFNNYLGKLRSLLLLEYPQKGAVRATDFLFPESP